jgi:hypothetical protein
VWGRGWLLRDLATAATTHQKRGDAQSGDMSGLSGEQGETVSLALQAAPAAIRRLIELTSSRDERVASVACNAVLYWALGSPRECELAQPWAKVDRNAYNAEELDPIERGLSLVLQQLRGPQVSHPNVIPPRAQAVSPDALQGRLASDLVQQIWAKTGLPIDQLLPQIAQHLPGVVDRMTPGGQQPRPAICSKPAWLSSRTGRRRRPKPFHRPGARDEAKPTVLFTIRRPLRGRAEPPRLWPLAPTCTRLLCLAVPADARAGEDVGPVRVRIPFV